MHYHWYLIKTRPGQTERAVRELSNQGYEVFCPKILVQRVRAGKRIQKTEPLFPGYLFIELSETGSNWRPIRSTRGVAHIVSFGNRPAIVPTQIVENLQERTSVQDEQHDLSPQQPISIEAGPFRHLNAIFLEYDGEKRAFLLLELLGRWQTLSLPLGDLKPL